LQRVNFRCCRWWLVCTGVVLMLNRERGGRHGAALGVEIDHPLTWLAGELTSDGIGVPDRRSQPRCPSHDAGQSHRARRGGYFRRLFSGVSAVLETEMPSEMKAQQLLWWGTCAPFTVKYVARAATARGVGLLRYRPRGSLCRSEPPACSVNGVELTPVPLNEMLCGEPVKLPVRLWPPSAAPVAVGVKWP